MAFDPDKYLGTTSASTSTFNPDAYLTAQAAREDTTKAQVTGFQYIANQAKLGLVDTPVLAQALIDTFVTDPFKKLYADITGKESTAPGGIAERFGRNIQRLQQAGATITGAETKMKAPDVLTGIIGSGVRATTDPLGYIGAPLRVAPAVGRATGLFTVGGTAEVGGIVGEQAEKAITGGDTGTGRAIGSITAAIKGAPAAAVIGETVSGAGNVIKQVRDKYSAFKTDPDAASQAYATGAAKRLLDIIAKEQPGQKLDDVLTEFNRISSVINKDELPLMVAMSDNPTVRQQVSRLAKTNPEFRNRVNIELQSLAANIDKRADVLFGQRYAPIQGAETVNVQNAIKRREAIDNQIENLSTRLDTGVDEAAIGRAVTNLVDARLKAVTAEMTPVYDSILQEAKKAGAKLPEESVRNVYNFVTANNIRDIFGKGTAVDKKIMREWSPSDIGFAPVGFDQVDSLKREINRLQRGSLTRDEARKLNQLEDVLNAERRNIPGEFNQRLIDADRAYYEKVGVPFSAQGIKDIDSKKYAEQVAPVIIKNGSSLRQFMNAVGSNNAMPITRNAILADAYSQSVVDGVVNPVKLRKYINKKDDVLSQVPEVRQELENAAVDQSVLALEKKRIDDAVKVANQRIADNFVTSVKDSAGVSVPNYQQITNRIFNDPLFFQKIKRDLKDLDAASANAVRQSMRAEIVNTARNSPDGGVAFLVNPKNAKVLNEVFGPGYTNAVKDVLKLSDAVNKADIGKLSAVIERSELDALGKLVPGLDIPFVTSTFRDRIASFPQKIVRLATRVNTAQLGDATDKAIADLLLDRNGVTALQKTAKEINFNLENPLSIKKVNDRFKSLLPQYMYVGGKEAAAQEPQQVQPEAVLGGFEE
jgi:hypothetical protein